jgi:hypothetical protein
MLGLHKFSMVQIFAFFAAYLIAFETIEAMQVRARAAHVFALFVPSRGYGRLWWFTGIRVVLPAAVDPTGLPHRQSTACR